MDPEIPKVFEQYRDPVNAPQSIIAFIIRDFSMLFVQNPELHVPRENVAPGEDLIEKLKKLIESASTPGKLEYKLPSIRPFTFDEDSRKTNCFFINGSSFHEKDGYEWRPLTSLGVDETIKSVTVFSQLYEAWSHMQCKDDTDENESLASSQDGAGVGVMRERSTSGEQRITVIQE
jgi:hypothetical protein